MFNHQKTRKVGIITLQGNEDNYGNVLQNYAVQSLIEALGYEAYTIDNKTHKGFLHPVVIKRTFWSKLSLGYILHYIKEKIGFQNVGDLNPLHVFCNYKNLKKSQKLELTRHNKFIRDKQRFNHYIDLSIEARHYKKSVFDDYYAFVVGSDQVWNPEFSSMSCVDFLRFVSEEKRIAFCVSFGIRTIPRERKQILAKWIREIPAISVRERDGVEIVRDLTGREVVHLLDPTFVIEKSEWNDYAQKPEVSLTPKHYLLMYFLGNRIPCYMAWIRKFAKNNKLQIVSVHDTHMLEYFSVSPTEFVWMIANAAMVCTDSFHGMALAINLNVPFKVFDRMEIGTSMFSRIESVLSDFDLRGCYFQKGDSIVDFPKIDFNSINKILARERKHTVDWLGEALHGIELKERFPLLASDSHCTGCGACYNACPFGAISMVTDIEGFVFPEINKEKCKKCLKCEQACPQDREKMTRQPLCAYYAVAKDENVLLNSSSGGAFYYLSKAVLDLEGVVYGAMLDNHFVVVHGRATNIEELFRIMTSKYVQSDIARVYTEVKESLEQQKIVLFSGTPCQVAGLKAFLGKEYSNLLTIDFLCHGTPSPKLWEIYKAEISFGRSIVDVNFREKKDGWRQFGLRIKFSDGTEHQKNLEEDEYLKAFLGNLSIRESCFQCQYRQNNRKSDITLADYWGISSVNPDKENANGVSLILVQTQKGNEWFEHVAKDNMEYGKTDLKAALQYNEASDCDPAYTKKREEFFELILNGASFSRTVNNLLWRDSIKSFGERGLRKASALKKRLSNIKKDT